MDFDLDAEIITILFFTGNSGKALEVQQKMGSKYMVTWEKIDIPEIQGTYSKNLTEENLIKQCNEIANDKAAFVCDNIVTKIQKGNRLKYLYKETEYDCFLIEDTALWLRELLAPGV